MQIGTVGDHRRSSDWRGSSNGPNPLCHEFVEDHEFDQNTLLNIRGNAPYFGPTSIKIGVCGVYEAQRLSWRG